MGTDGWESSVPILGWSPRVKTEDPWEDWDRKHSGDANQPDMVVFGKLQKNPSREEKSETWKAAKGRRTDVESEGKHQCCGSNVFQEHQNRQTVRTLLKESSMKRGHQDELFQRYFKPQQYFLLLLSLVLTMFRQPICMSNRLSNLGIDTHRTER